MRGLVLMTGRGEPMHCAPHEGLLATGRQGGAWGAPGRRREVQGTASPGLD
jgi:hypothetical protein